MATLLQLELNQQKKMSKNIKQFCSVLIIFNVRFGTNGSPKLLLH